MERKQELGKGSHVLVVWSSFWKVFDSFRMYLFLLPHTEGCSSIRDQKEKGLHSPERCLAGNSIGATHSSWTNLCGLRDRGSLCHQAGLGYMGFIGAPLDPVQLLSPGISYMGPKPNKSQVEIFSQNPSPLFLM